MRSVQQMFAAFLNNRRFQNVSENTIIFYRDTAGKFVEWLGDRPLNKQVIYEYTSEIRKRNLTSGTVCAHLRGIKAFLNFCAEEEMIEPSRSSYRKSKRRVQES